MTLIGGMILEKKTAIIIGAVAGSAAAITLGVLGYIHRDKVARCTKDFAHNTKQSAERLAFEAKQKAEDAYYHGKRFLS